MYIQNIEDIPERKMAPHGKDVLSFRFFMQEFQNYSEALDNYNYKNPKNNALWNYIGYVEIPVGARSGKHTHHGNDEIFFILEGKAELDSNGKRTAIKPNDVVLTKSGEEHEIVNVVETLKFITLEVLTLESVNKE